MKWTIMVAAMIPAFSTLILTSHAELPGDTARVTFTVHCYDVGGSALDGLPGVISVEKGWLNSKEVNRIVYDPEKISVQQMENRLKKAETYLGTVTRPVQENNRKEIHE